MNNIQQNHSIKINQDIPTTKSNPFSKIDFFKILLHQTGTTEPLSVFTKGITKKLALFRVKKDGDELKHLPLWLRQDPDVVFEAVKQNKDSIVYAEPTKTYIWENTAEYLGQKTLANGERTGKGFFIWDNKDRYAGDFVDGQRTGKGIYIWGDEDRYEGDFLNNQRTGKGTFTWTNGDRYEGGFVNGQRTGEGVYTWANGNRYEGSFVNGQCTGEGVYTWANGDRYEGGFVNDQCHGKGKIIHKDGTSWTAHFSHGFSCDTNIANLGDGKFLDLLIGTKNPADMTYALGIMIGFLQSHHEYKEEYKALQFAYDMFFLSKTDLEKASNDIYNNLFSGKDQVLLYGSKGHATVLSLKLIGNYVHCTIFNSGEGLPTYHEQKKDNKKLRFQTKRTTTVPTENFNKETIKTLLQFHNLTIAESYANIDNIPGAKQVNVESQSAVWQTPQKGNNCTLECLFAYLKNNMEFYKYIKMRRTLFLSCINKLQKNNETNTDPKIDELKRKSDKRQTLLTNKSDS